MRGDSYWNIESFQWLCVDERGMGGSPATVWLFTLWQKATEDVNHEAREEKAETE
jgi:hypothetical protein